VISIDVLPPGEPRAAAAQRAYFDELVGRYHGRAATDDEIAAALRDAASDDLAPPTGLFLVAHDASAVFGCAGLRLIPGPGGPGSPDAGRTSTGEVTRLFVVPPARRRGVASRLLQRLEDHARVLRLPALRLDTRHDLVEARALYARHGYREVPAFNDRRYADQWFHKELDPRDADGPT
jgi:GNAT superfamily N-acetyltransferase